jgi:transposase
MPRPYSVDLRERVLRAHERGEGGCTALARRFGVGAATVYDWLVQARTEGRRTPKPLGHGRVPLGGAEDVLRALVVEQGDATLAEYAERLAQRTGQRRSPAAICRALKRLKLARKTRRSMPPSTTARTSRKRGPYGTPTWPGLRRSGASSWMRVASTPA